MRRALLALLGAATVGCGPSSPPDGTGGAAGSAGAQSLSVEALDVRGGTTPAPIVSGGPLELFAPPQGGFVVLIGARVAGLDSKTVELAARLTSATGMLLAESTRTTELVPAPKAGWLETDASDLYSAVHLTLCPPEPSVTVADESAHLELLVTELYSDFSSGRVEFDVTPTCVAGGAADADYCRCQCGVKAACTPP